MGSAEEDSKETINWTHSYSSDVTELLKDVESISEAVVSVARDVLVVMLSVVLDS